MSKEFDINEVKACFDKYFEEAGITSKIAIDNADADDGVYKGFAGMLGGVCIALYGSVHSIPDGLSLLSILAHQEDESE